MTWVEGDRGLVLVCLETGATIWRQCQESPAGQGCVTYYGPGNGAQITLFEGSFKDHVAYFERLRRKLVAGSLARPVMVDEPAGGQDGEAKGPAAQNHEGGQS